MRAVTKDIARKLITSSRLDYSPLMWGRVAYYEHGVGLYVEVNTEVLNLAPDDEDSPRWEERKLLYLWPRDIIPEVEKALIFLSKPGELVLVRLSGNKVYKLEHIINKRVVYTAPNTQSRNRGAPVAYVAYEWSGEWVGVEPKRIGCFVTHPQIDMHDGLYPHERQAVHNALTAWEWQRSFEAATIAFNSAHGPQLAERMAWIKAFTNAGFEVTGMCGYEITLTYVTVELTATWDTLLSSGIDPADTTAFGALQEQMLLAVLEVAE